jgi:hypothetical protein
MYLGDQDSDVIEAALAGLEASLPAVIARKEIPKYVGGSISVGTLANLGKNGPPYFLVNKHATYEKKSFLAWYRAQIKKAR